MTPLGEADPERLHKVLANLVENAARFTTDDAPVHLRARGDDATVTIEVIESLGIKLDT